MKRNKLLALPLAIALGLEIIAPGGEEQHPHTEKEIILARNRQVPKLTPSRRKLQERLLLVLDTERAVGGAEGAVRTAN